MKISMMKIVTKSISGLILLFSILVLAAILIFGYRPIVVMSGSMEPQMPVGSVSILDTKYSYYDVKIGDVVTFKLPTGSQVTHRVVGITEEGLETKGDANDVSDGIIATAYNFRGKILFSIPKLGYAVQFFLTTKGKILAGTFLAAIFMLSFIPTGEEKEGEADEK